MLTWEGNKLGEKRYTHKPVSPVMESEAPCCGDGLSGICLLIIHFIFKILTTPESNIFHFFPKILNSSPPSPNCYRFEKSSTNSQKKIIELRSPTKLSHFLTEWSVGYTFKKQGGHQRKIMLLTRLPPKAIWNQSLLSMFSIKKLV